MKCLRYVIYFVVASVTLYLLSKYVEKSLIGAIISFLVLTSVVFSMLCLEVFKFGRR